MLNKDEKKILISIKILPIVIIIILSAVVTYFFTVQNKNGFKDEIKATKEDFVKTNKNRIKTQVIRMSQVFENKYNEETNRINRHLKDEINQIHSVMTNLYNTNKNLPKIQLKKLIKNTIRGMRFNEGRDYFFIYDLEGVNVLHPIKPELEGKNLLGYQDKKGKKIIKEMIPILKEKGEAYSKWWWSKPYSKDEFEKIGYHKVFKPFNWFVGTGIYLDDYEKDLKDKLLLSLENSSFDEEDYFFIFNKNGLLISTHNKYMSKNQKLNEMDISKQEIVNKIIKVASFGEGFTSYKIEKGFETKASEKISYIKKLNHFGWILGYGFHPKDINNKIKHKTELFKKENKIIITRMFLLNVFVTIILIVLLILFSDFVKKQFIIHKNKNRKYQNELHTVIDDKTTKLIRLNKTLEERIIEEVTKNREKDKIMFQQSKMAALGELLGMITHQWRQPLAQINSTTLNMYNNYKKGEFSLDLLKKDISEIEDTTNFLSQTITDFSNFFSPDKEKNIFSTKQAVTECLHILFPKFIHRVNIQVDVIEDIHINSYITQYQQAVLTILINALDMFEVRNIDFPMIKIEISEHEGKSKLTISDNAQGINKECLDKIFEAYFSTKKSKKNSGLGLYISKMIIEQNMNGTLSVENTYDGAKFTITI
jgi:signal transduction histidine kinase